jgi:hypothetical protein
MFNAESLSGGGYQLIEAYRPITDTFIVQVLGAIRSHLQDFVLEISNLSWDKVLKVIKAAVKGWLEPGS